MNNIIEINDITAPELDVYARTSEVQLLRYYEPEPGLFIAESPKVIERALNAGYEPLSFLVEHKDLEGEAKQILERYPEYQPHRNPGECRESDKYRSHFPQRSGTSYGCGPSDQRVQ